MKINIIQISLWSIFAFASATYAQKNQLKSEHQVVLSSEVNWTPLNPARGDNSPKAGTLWGDREGTQATGFLVQFKKGFASPPHIHNVTYRGIVIKGLVHNDDPDAANMWMPTGSFWTQPAGESHITSAKADENMAYIEINQGPYLVKPTSKAFDNGERPVNVDASNMVWLGAKETKLIKTHKNAKTPKIAFLWEDSQNKGLLISIPKGFKGSIKAKKTFRSVVIQGALDYQDQTTKNLLPGSYFSSKGVYEHFIQSPNTTTLLYVRTPENIKITSH
ncbi:DUF4437 domain-containing protein [Ochrovirga pacifica]|uniref:DUF4437 domain-containing protein n=1 Tax=Ochrovirga pacifica TaxID=1042376 RepID=UPI000255A52D|nr:DUF4437 domain-containing protein [Ochrovirga pacifica]